MAKGPELEVAARQALDPATQRRQEHLFRQAEGFAAQQPFQQQYGYGSSMVPGLSGMSQTGQGYLTDKILGKGAYRIQNLGFQDYQRPSTAQPGGFQYGQSGYMPGQQFTPGYQTGRYRTGMAPEGGDGSMAWGGGGVPGTDPGGGDGGGDLTQAELDDLGLATQPRVTAGRAQFGTQPYQGQGQVPYTAPTAPGATTGLGPQGDPAAWTPWQQETWKTGAPSGMAGVNQPSYELNIFDTPDTPFGAQNLPTATSGAQYAGREGTGGGLLQTDLGRPTSGVGIGEIEDARTATRRLLMEGPRTSDPGYNQFIGTGGWQGISPAAGVNQFLGAGGWQGLAPAGTGTAPGDPSIGAAGDFAVPTADQLEIGGTDADFDFGVAGDQDMDALTPWQRRNEAGELIGEAGYAPDYTEVGAGDVTGAADDPRYTDPTTGELYEGWGEKAMGVTDPTAITDILGTQATGKAFREGWGIKDPTIGGTDWTGETPWDEKVTATDVDVSGITTPTLTDAERITAEEIGAADTAGFAVTPQTIAAPTDVKVDPLTGTTTQDVAGVDPTAFTGASFLGGDLGAYMDQGGVESQVTAAELDFQRAQNQEQARRAQSLAWGTRGDIPRAEQETAMLARISEIRRKGYTDAADRMEADLQRQQAAGMQTQQLGMQGGLQGQQLQAQRRESDAARAQQAAMQGQQLGTQADLQTQQLAQQGGIRGAELGMQAGMQAQQLEAQRMESNAARRQQAALAGQELGGRYGLQTQQLGQQAAMRNAEMGMQAAMANQQAALQTGTQSQQLEAQRQIEQARLKLQGQQQTQQLGVQTGLAAQGLEAQRAESQAGRAQQAAMAQYQGGLEGAMQTQRLGVGADQRQAELGMQAALANQQAQLQTGGQQAELEARRRESSAQLGQQAQIQTAQNELQAAMADQQAALSSGNQTAQLEAQRKIREAELQLQRGMQTQQLGAGSAEQQTQNEFARRQALAGMGQDAASQQTQNEFLRRQELSRMGLQAQGMGMDDQARFREQQMAMAQQLGRQGMDEQAATFGAAQQLAQMGGTQEQRQQMQAAADYEQWLRSQEGFADEAAFLQAMQPTPGQTQYQRKPSVWGQIGGGLLAGAGVAAQAGAFGSDARIKDNIEYVGMENGFKTYEFNYLGRDNRYKGVMAQEVMVERPDAVEMQDGFYRVNYDAIGVQFEAV